MFTNNVLVKLSIAWPLPVSCVVFPHVWLLASESLDQGTQIKFCIRNAWAAWKDEFCDSLCPHRHRDSDVSVVGCSSQTCIQNWHGRWFCCPWRLRLTGPVFRIKNSMPFPILYTFGIDFGLCFSILCLCLACLVSAPRTIIPAEKLLWNECLIYSHCL